MYILAFKLGHDPAACLLKDGSIVAACEEERLNRIKHAPGMAPWKAIRYCLEAESITLDDIDHLVYAGSSWPSLFGKLSEYYLLHWPIRNWPVFRSAVGHLLKAGRSTVMHFQGGAPYQTIFHEFNVTEGRVEKLDHHLCHAASAYYFSGFSEAAVITMDGKGDATSILFGDAHGGEIEVLERKGIPNSLGFAYAGVTAFIGFEINEGEYRVMGLAPYGEPRFSLEDIFHVTESGELFVDQRYTYYDWNQKYLEKKFGVPRRKPTEPILQIHKDIAASLQRQLEISVTRLAKALICKTQRNKLCIAGGVGLNVKMNQALFEANIAKDIFVQPASGDAGTVLGAAGYLYHRLTGKTPEPITHLYYGPSSTDEEIVQVLKNSPVHFEPCEDISKTVAELLDQGKVVGWFQGRLEFGPRALGSRSILADPRRSEMKDIVNEKIKFREPFRPFCPSMLTEDLKEMVENYHKAPFMIVSFRVKNGVAERIPAVVHVDGTIRPQEVFADTNPLYHRMISNFKMLSGVGVVMNTSFNRKGEPIVTRPEEALDVFLNTDMDALAIGNYLVRKLA